MVLGKRLREVAVARELHDAVLRELVGAEMRLIIVQAGARRGQHIVEVEGVRRVVVDLEVHRAVGA